MCMYIITCIIGKSLDFPQGQKIDQKKKNAVIVRQRDCIDIFTMVQKYLSGCDNKVAFESQ